MRDVVEQVVRRPDPDARQLLRVGEQVAVVAVGGDPRLRLRAARAGLDAAEAPFETGVDRIGERDDLGALDVVEVEDVLGAAEGVEVGVALDEAGWSEIVGTISGDDTIFVATASQRQQQLLLARLEQAFPKARRL